MKRAIIYIRVSTDEQADKGYSLTHQEERLRKYCELNKIEIVAIFKEDYSAKTFERPEFKKLLQLAKKNKGKINYLLFINWSRFSRNAGDAYGMINQLSKLNIEAQAIEQPLDLSIPENKMMLAFYLAAPEVENDRRSLNVTYGMRRAKKEGRWMASAPIGYKNVRDEKGKALIIPNEFAPLMKEAFEELSKGLFSQKEIFHKLKKKGLKCTLNNFQFAIRNPVYCGKLFIPAFKDESSMYVNGIHESIITEKLFLEVQDILNGKKRSYPVNVVSRRDELPLRGFLVCCRCGKNLTGSASKGNGGKYYYYHCEKGCKERLKAIEINDKVFEIIKSISIDPGLLDLFFEIVKRKFYSNEKERLQKLEAINNEIKLYQERKEKALQLMLDGKLDPDEYQSIKKKMEDILYRLTEEKTSFEIVDNSFLEFLKKDIEYLKKIDLHYQEADLEGKQKIISSVFDEKFIFEKSEPRTIPFTEVIRLINLTKSELGGNKKGLKKNFSLQPSKVGPVGIEPTTP